MYKENIVPELLRECGAFESLYHFLFNCPRNANVRGSHLPETLNNCTTRDLLQETKTNTVKENETLFENVQKLLQNLEAMQYHDMS